MELVGLCYSTVNFLAKLNQQAIYPHSGVRINSEGDGGGERVLSLHLLV